MKLYFIKLFLILGLYLQAQEIPTKDKYNAVVVDLVRSGIFVCFPLYVQKNDGSVFRVLTSNYGLFHCYYSKRNDYPVEFADTVSDILNFEFVGLRFDKCPKLIKDSIDNSLYKQLEKKRIKKIIKKYFDLYVHQDNSKHFRVKKEYLSKREILTVLCFMCDNHFIITSDNDGYYTAALLN